MSVRWQLLENQRERELSAAELDQPLTPTRITFYGRESKPEQRYVLCVGKRLFPGVLIGTTLIGRDKLAGFSATVVTEPSHYGSLPTGVNGLRITYSHSENDAESQ